MMVPVNQNIDEYRDDFYKGLTFKQTLVAGVAVITGACVFLFWYLYIGVSQTIALYLTLPVVFPIAAVGFLKIQGMNLLLYVRRKYTIHVTPAYYYHPTILFDMDETEEVPVKKKGKEIYLETEELLYEKEYEGV